MSSVASSFSTSYAEAREKFLAAVAASGAQLLESHENPNRGPDGRLFTDVARIGPADARKLLVLVSSTHGIEGYCGSGCQVGWLARRHYYRDATPDTAVILIHAVNPFGFAWGRRVTEENVDLNRNFVDFAAPLPRNSGYEEVHRIVTPERWDEPSVAAVFRSLDQFKQRVGEQKFSDSFNGGQYSHPDGVYYGGAREQWSNRAFRRVVKEHFSSCKKICFVDLHTGIGPRYDHIYLCFHPPGSPGYERARVWWGERAVNREGVTHKALAVYHGLLIDAFEAMLGSAELTTLVVEFGTLQREGVQRASLLQRWLRWHGPGEPERARQLLPEYEEAYYPSEPRWRTTALEQAQALLDRGLRGVSSW